MDDENLFRARDDLPLAVVLAALAVILALAPIRWPLEDFVEYWAAGRLNAVAANPYDPAAMLAVQRTVGWTDSAPVMMYNPPWTLALTMPMSALPFGLARAIWLPVQIFLVLWSASRMWILYGGEPAWVRRAWYLGLLWSPTLLALRLGQLSPLMLVGLVGFLWEVRRARDFRAGAWLALTAVKPQLLALVWLAVALWAAAGRKWSMLAGAAAMLVVSSGAALIANPHVFGQYVSLMAAAPPTLTFESPNVATVLRAATGTRGSWVQYVPTMLGAVLISGMWLRRRRNWQWVERLPGVLLLSCLLTSYGGWAFDLVVLLIPIVARAVSLTHTPRRSAALTGLATFAALSALALVMHAQRLPQAAFIWMTPAVALAWWALAMPQAHDRGV